MIEPSSGLARADPTIDRARTCLSLLRGLSTELGHPIVFKRPAEALAGSGDIDAYARPEASADIEWSFRAWATREGLRVATVCRHDWRGPTFVAIDPADPAPFVLDVKVGRLSRGSLLFSIDDLDGLTVVDRHGIVHLRPGVDGAVKLLVDGTTRTGARHDARFEAKRVHAALISDRDGAMDATRFVGPAASALRRGIDAVLAGGWSRRDMATVVAWCYARAIVRPDLVARQIHWRFVAAPSCAIAPLVPPPPSADREAWFMAIEDAHRNGHRSSTDEIGGDEPATAAPPPARLE